jgi:uncharacterized protein (TIGR00369 family)
MNITNREQVIAEIEKRSEHTIFKALSFRVESYDPEVIVAVDVDWRHHQVMGLVHGGVYVTLAESAASLAGGLVVAPEGKVVVGMEINANHLKSVTGGTVRAKASCLHRGRSTLVYGIDVTNELGERLCVSRCTLMVKEP